MLIDINIKPLEVTRPSYFNLLPSEISTGRWGELLA
jgi:hypothetical protein